MRDTPTQWNPRQTAIIICDMRDGDWCQSAVRRAAELAPKINRVVAAARAAGVLIVHAPSNVMEYYKETPQRKRAQDVPADPRAPADLDKQCDRQDGEPALPINESDTGDDCQPIQQRIYQPFKRQIDLIEIRPEDVVSDSGREQWNLFAGRGIENVILMGVHADVDVLGSSFGLRQWVRHGKNVVLVRDLTDTLHNPHWFPVRPPRAVAPRWWSSTKAVCPSITSADLVGDPARNTWCFSSAKTNTEPKRRCPPLPPRNWCRAACVARSSMPTRRIAITFRRSPCSRKPTWWC